MRSTALSRLFLQDFSKKGKPMDRPMDAAATADVTLDCAGLKCPMPVLRAAKALRSMTAGQVLCVTATDKAAPKDFQTFCAEGGHVLMATEVLDDTAQGQLVRFTIRRGN